MTAPRSVRVTAVIAVALCGGATAETQPGPGTGEVADARFRRFDKNGDGKLTAEEVGIAAVFAAADKDGDGSVTPEEFEAYRGSRQGAASKRKSARGEARGRPAPVSPTEDVAIHRDIRYRETPGAEANLQSLDVYSPKDAEHLPVMIYIHGGGWQGGDKGAVGSKAGYFCGRGWVFVSINYRLVPAVDLPTQLQDSADAIAWVHSNIGEYGGDPSRLHLMGHSAGAHHVAILATNERFLKAAGKDLGILKGVVELDTQALDVPRMMGGSETAVYVQAFGKNDGIWREVSPFYHVEKGKGIPPFFLVVADNREQKIGQAKAFQTALRDAGVRCEFVEAPEHDHGSLNRAIGEPGDKVTAAMAGFLGISSSGAPGAKSRSGTVSGSSEAASGFGPRPASEGLRPFDTGAALHEIVKAYAALGEHRAASEVDAHTADWLAGLLREAGLRVEFQEFEVPQLQLKEARLKVEGQGVDCFPHWPPKVTAVPVIAPMALGDAAALRGRVALVEAVRGSWRQEGGMVHRLASSGAAGAVILLPPGDGGIHVPNVRDMDGVPEIPVLYAADVHREKLLRAAKQGETAELFIDGEFQPRAKARNVIAAVDRGPKRIVVSTPYSGWFRCGGERGSGLAMFVALARWAAQRDGQTSYTFVANSAHEIGYAGMRAFLEERAPKPDAVACWFHIGANVALLPEARPAEGTGQTRLFTTKPEWESKLAPLFQDAPWVRVATGRQPNGELALVAPGGYEALNLAGGGNRFMHSPQDGPEATGPAVLEPLARALIRMMQAIELGFSEAGKGI